MNIGITAKSSGIESICYDSPSMGDHVIKKTIEQNKEEEDEFLIGGFTPEPFRTIHPPRIKEAFLTYECTLESFTGLSGSGLNSMIIRRIQHAAKNGT